MDDPVPCDVCGQPVVPGQMVYGLGWRHDDEGRIVSGRHWDCHTPVEDLIGRIRSDIEKAALQADSLQAELGLPPRRRR